MENATRKLQWHPAFYAGLQIEFEDEKDNLIFENEHQLSTKPLGIDVLVIKKKADIPIQKNIGQIFRKHNILEYKSPEDYLGIDDFYKVYAYACFYKADTPIADSIKISEITASLVTYRYPIKLVKHLKENGHEVEYKEDGIYYIHGFMFPIQIIHTPKLSREENLWLRSLTNRLDKDTTVKTILNEYDKYKGINIYQSVMNIIVDANKPLFEEDNTMCEAMMEILERKFKDKIEAAENCAMERGLERGLEQGLEQGLERGLEQGLERGISQAIRRMQAKGFSKCDILDLGYTEDEYQRAIQM